MSYGWICPRCKTVHAPQIVRCNCKPEEPKPRSAPLGEMYQHMASLKCDCGLALSQTCSQTPCRHPARFVR